MKKGKKAISFVLATLMLLSVMIVMPVTASAMTNQEGANWALARIGQGIDTDHLYGYQCKDFVNAYTQQNFGVTFPGHACDLIYDSLPSGWQRIKNYAAFVPQPGDIAVWGAWNGNPYGHTGVIISANVNSFVSVDQNWVNFNANNGSVAAKVTHNYTSPTFWGVIRPPFSTPAPVPVVHNPDGYVDVVEGRDNAVYVRGWAFDRDDMGAQLAIHVYVGGPAGSGAPSYAITANTYRDDVNRGYGCGDYHGYDAVVSTGKLGTQGIYVYAINVGGGDNCLIGSGTANITMKSDNIGDKFYGKIIHTSSNKAVIGTDNGNVELATAAENDNQIWYFEKQSDNSYKIVNKGFSGKCLDLYNGLTTNTNNIQLCASNNNDAQRWYAVKNGSGYSLLSKLDANKAVDLTNGNTEDGANIAIFDKNGTDAQTFTFQTISNTDFYVASSTKEFNGHKYEYYNYNTTWKQAEKICSLKGGHLLTITSQEEQNFINGILSENNNDIIWAGGTDEYSEGNWKWITGEPMDYKNWAENQPDNWNNVETHMNLYNNGTWNDTFDTLMGHDCSFICEYESVDETKYSPAATAVYNDNEYEFYTNSVTWEDAKKICEQKGGHLVTIQNISENNMIYDKIKTLGTSSYWIGLTDKDSEGTFKWINDEPLQYKNWSADEPNNSGDNENYAAIYSDSGKWNDRSNYAGTYLGASGFICEYEKSTDLTKYTPIKTVNYNNTVYDFFDKNVSWKKAEEICSYRGGHLAVITSSVENSVLQAAAKEASIDYLWLGGSDDQTEGTWQWKVNTKEAFDYTNWDEGQPDNNGTNENYLEMISQNGKWNDVPNNGRWDQTSCGFICEYPQGEIRDNDYMYSINSNGTVTINKYLGTDTSVEIPSKINGITVSSIGNKAFYECSLITEVEIPATATSVGNETFRGCKSLVKVNLPEGIDYISYGLFYGCESLTEIKIPESVKIIGQAAFINCKSLKSIKIPKNVSNIYIFAFWGCSSLEKFMFMNKETIFYDMAFVDCTFNFGYRSVPLPNGAVPVMYGYNGSEAQKRAEYSIKKGLFKFDIFGDVNGDGNVNMHDIAIMQYYASDLTVFTEEQKICGDLNEDEQVTLKDCSLLQNELIE